MIQAKRFLIVLSLLLVLAVVSVRKPLLAQPGEVIVSASDILADISAGNPVNLNAVTVIGDLDFREAAYQMEGEWIIDVPITITKAVFENQVEGGTDQLRFTQPLNFSDSNFEMQVNFGQAQFDAPVHFAYARFHSVAAFDGAFFAERASFENAEFNQNANFFETRFAAAEFYGSVIERRALFINATFSEEALFFSSQFKGGAAFGLATFEDEANFSETLFEDIAEFESATFKATVIMSQSVFEQAALFSEASASELNLRGVRFNDALHLDNATIGVLDLAEIVILDGQLDLLSTKFEQLRLDNFDVSLLMHFDDESISHIDKTEALRNLEKGLKQNDNLRLANEISFFRNQLERRNLESRVASTLEYLFVELPFGYFVKPWRPLLSSVTLILLFSLFYFPRGTLEKAAIRQTRQERDPADLELKNPPMQVDYSWPERTLQTLQRTPLPTTLRKLVRSNQFIRAWKALFFSLTVFTRRRMGNQEARRNQTIVVIEWVIGKIMITALLITLSQTYPPLNKLVESIF